MKANSIAIIALTLILGVESAPSNISNFTNITIPTNGTLNSTNSTNLTSFFQTSFVNASLNYNFYNASLINEISTNLTILYGTNNFTDARYNNNTITQKLIQELLAIDNSTTLDDCQRCITRLELGKSMSLTRPELIAPAWTQWCIESEFDTEVNCLINYGRNTVQNSTTGANFVNVMSLMEPAGYDGQLYCYYQEGVCSKPETPNVDISYMWPAKPAKAMVAPTPGNDTFNVLHLSDIHMELDYQIGAEANCTDSMCCTPHSINELERPLGFNFTDNLSDYEVDGLSFYNSSYVNGSFVQGDYIDVFSNDSIWWPAGTFGNYECDSPEVLINSSLYSIVEFQANNSINFDFAIFTGDLVDHDLSQFISFEKAVMEEELTFRDMKYQLQNLPVFPVLGNHDTFPYLQMAQNSSGYSNLFDWNAELMADLWEDYDWLDQSNASYAAKHYAGFSVSTKRGLKIISLNANAWYNENLYNYWNASNPDSFGQFQFLVDELVASENIDQRVWIIAHIPFNEEALPVPALAFASIVERFSPYTIAGIFFGHTHLDQFNILYSGNGSNSTKTADNAIANAWISQAITPWVENNPSWRYYTVDTKTFSIMNSYNFYTKLNDTFTNGGDAPVWEFEYSAREAYNIPHWSPSSPLNATFWHYVAQNIRNDIEINQMYTNFESRFSPYTTDCETSGLCRGNWCYVSSFTTDEFDACVQLSNITSIYE